MSRRLRAPRLTAAMRPGLRDLVHLLKYERVRPAANVLGRMLAEVVADLAEAFGPQPPVVMAVPLHTSKMRQRGFNQSELIARAMLKLKPAALDAKLNTTALVRHRATESQTGLTPPQRRDNVRGAFEVVRGDQIRGRDILVGRRRIHHREHGVGVRARVAPRRGRARFRRDRGSGAEAGSRESGAGV